MPFLDGLLIHCLFIYIGLASITNSSNIIAKAHIDTHTYTAPSVRTTDMLPAICIEVNPTAFLSKQAAISTVDVG